MHQLNKNVDINFVDGINYVKNDSGVDYRSDENDTIENEFQLINELVIDNLYITYIAY